jgi:hypothetical protein
LEKKRKKSRRFLIEGKLGLKWSGKRGLKERKKWVKTGCKVAWRRWKWWFEEKGEKSHEVQFKKLELKSKLSKEGREEGREEGRRRPTVRGVVWEVGKIFGERFTRGFWVFRVLDVWCEKLKADFGDVWSRALNWDFWRKILGDAVESRVKVVFLGGFKML